MQKQQSVKNKTLFTILTTLIRSTKLHKAREHVTLGRQNFSAKAQVAKVEQLEQY